MNIKFSRLTETCQGIEDITENLNFFQKCLDEDTEGCLADDFMDFIEDTKAELAWALLDAGEYEKGLALYQSLSWKTRGKEKMQMNKGDPKVGNSLIGVAGVHFAK